MKKWSFGALAFLGIISIGLLLGSPSTSYALDLTNYNEDTAFAVVIASVDSGVDAQCESTFAVEQNSQVDKGASSEVSDQITWHQGWISPEEGAGFWRWGLSDGTIAVSSWRYINGSWYWFDDQGRMAQDGLVQIGGTTYGFSSSGTMRVGWYFDTTGPASVWRYFSGSGALVKGWLSDGGRWYWLDPADGSMATGLNACNGTPYIFNGSGAMLSSQWALVDNNWYYADSNGLLHGG